MSKRYFLFQDSKSDKFWNIDQTGDSYEVHYGRSGTSGQNQTKSFSSEDAAQKAAEKLIEEKLKKGYSEVDGSGAAAVAPAAARRGKPAEKPEVTSRRTRLRTL